SFFDMVDQKWMIRFVEHRIGDPRIIRLIRKWMKAGVLEDGEFKASERGTKNGRFCSIGNRSFRRPDLTLRGRRAQRRSRRATGPRATVRLVLDRSEHADTLNQIDGGCFCHWARNTVSTAILAA